MIQLFKNFTIFLAVSLVITSCGDQRAESRISDLENRLQSCYTDKVNDHNLIANKFNELLHICQKSGSIAQASAFYSANPIASFIILLAFLALFVAGAWYLMTLALDKWSTIKYNNIYNRVENLKQEEFNALQSIENASSKLTHIKNEINALNSQKTSIQNKLDELIQYNNVDELKHKAQIIEDAEAEAEQIIADANAKIKAQVNEIQQNINSQKAELQTKADELAAKEEELETLRQSMING